MSKSKDASKVKNEDEPRKYNYDDSDTRGTKDLGLTAICETHREGFISSG